jgi:hypothetical protein
MAAPRTIRVPPDSELSMLLHDAMTSGELVLIDTGDAVYRVGVESARRVDPTRQRPAAEELERSRAGIREAAGSWRDIDAEAFKAYIRERRRTANRPSVEL